jgi:predicted Zn-dependent peptidase
MRPLIPIALLSLLISAHAGVDRTRKPDAGPAPEAAFPDYVTKVLPNGLKIFVIEDDRKPTLTLRLSMKAGDALDGDKPGIAGFVASLLNRGTATRDALTFAKTVDSLGATLEAGSGPDAISVSTSGLTKIADPLLDLFADAIIHPVFSEEEFAKAQKRAYSGLTAQKKEPHSLVGKLMNVTLFGEHPYGKITTPESVKSITRDDLAAFHSTWFAPNNASLAIVGDVKAADILPKIEKALGAWPRKDVPMIKKAAVKPIAGLTIHLLDLPGSVQSNVIVCRNAPSRAGTPDLPEVNVMNSILGGGFSGRLFQNLREKHGYTYGSSSAFGYNKEAGYFQATAETRNDVTAPAITEILGELTRIMTEPVAEPELELQRQYNIGNYLLSLESAGRVASRVQDIELYDLAPDFYKTYAKRMAAVTPAKVKELAGKYLSTADTAIVVVGDAKQVRASLEKLGTVVLYDTDLKVVK